MAAVDDGVAPADRDYAKQLGIRLRAIRTQQGMSLQAVERKSDGKWKAVVVGSYERGDRSVSVSRLAELSDFYGVPINELLPGGRSAPARGEEFPRLVLDLAALQQLDEDRAGPLRRFVSTIQVERGDFGNRIMSLRAEDLRALAIMYDRPVDEFYEMLLDWDLLSTDAG
jgi:transcriptional regulator with XRE-family HTH domain